MTITMEDAIRTTGVEVLEYLDRQAEVPVLTGPQRQGDLILVPHRAGADVGKQVPAEGVPVIRGEAGGNTHLLVSDGPIMWRPALGGDQSLGTVTVPDGSTGFLAHPEHGYLGIGPGSYTIGRQREQADEIRQVAD